MIKVRKMVCQISECDISHEILLFEDLNEYLEYVEEEYGGEEEGYRAGNNFSFDDEECITNLEYLGEKRC